MEVQGVKLSMPVRRSVGRLSLRTKILLITGLTGGLVATLLSVVFTVQMRDALRNELASRARVVSIQLASNLAAATAARSQVTLQQAADATLRDVAEVAYVVVRDTQGEVLAVASEKSRRAIQAPGKTSKAPMSSDTPRASDRSLKGSSCDAASMTGKSGGWMMSGKRLSSPVKPRPEMSPRAIVM